MRDDKAAGHVRLLFEELRPYYTTLPVLLTGDSRGKGRAIDAIIAYDF